MESKRLLLPEQRNYESAYELAYKLACEQIAKMRDLEQQCLKCDAQYQVLGSKKIITLQYLNQLYQIILPQVGIALVNSTEAVPVRDRILLLHYFILAKGTPLANRLITFRELPEGNVYTPTFAQRTIKSLVDHFGKDPNLLLDLAKKLGAFRVDYGDMAVTINAFSRVPITIILWRGDEELAPQANILFDATISDYLSTEDIVVLCETLTWKLVRFFRAAYTPFGGGN